MQRISIKQIALSATVFFIFLLAFSSAEVFAQNPGEVPPADAAQDNQDTEWRSQLNLTPDQVAKIRTILEQNKFERQAARRRVNQAQRALDQAIYADDANEATIEQRAHELVEAQRAEVRLRAMTELGVRRVLTPEQLNTFRMIRQQRLREAQIKRRLENGNQQRPLKNPRLENGINPPPRNGDANRPAGGGQGGRNANPALTPRERRGLLPRRIRP